MQLCFFAFRGSPPQSFYAGVPSHSLAFSEIRLQSAVSNYSQSPHMATPRCPM